MVKHIDVNEFLGRRTLIAGDVNAGKTRYCLDILLAFVRAGRRNIAVLDFAPASISGVGGKLMPSETSGVFYFSADISAPRLTGRDETEIIELAEHNARTIECLLDDYLFDPKDILFINDITLYLHAGSIDKILSIIDLSSTIVINAYYGSAFANMPLSAQEKRSVEHLMKRMDRVVRV